MERVVHEVVLARDRQELIAFIYGTTGELIKLAPVLKRLDESEYISFCTGQQIEQIPPMLRELSIPEPEMWWGVGHHGKDLSKLTDIPGWAAGVIARFMKAAPGLRRRLSSADKNIVVVHGDTFTTVLGAGMGRALRLPVAHIEGGLRSGNWRHPFPEELDRLAASRLAQYHFAPGDTAVSNLSRAKGRVINTHANTVKDSLDLVPAGTTLPRETPEHFGIVSLHRNELLRSREALSSILEVLREHGQEVPLLFIEHPPTVAAVERFGFDGYFDDRQLVRIEKLGYFEFIALLKRSSFLVTDSGGVQEECYYLDHPCLIHRLTTERTEGLGANVLLSRMDLAEVKRFLRNPQLFRVGSPPSFPSPSDVIVRTLREEGFV